MTEDRRRKRAWIAIGMCASAVVAIIVLGVVLSENVVYFRTVSEAVARRADQGSDRFRLAGKVVPGTIHEIPGGVRFVVSDGKAKATVVHQGDPPDLFKAGAPIVCEGHWGRAKAFDSDRIMIRHGNEYTPPKVDLDRKSSSA